MDIKAEKRGAILKVFAEGRIDTLTAPEYGMQVTDELDDIKELILDFSKIDYISSLGLRVILELQKQMNQQGKMKLVNVQQSVMDIFMMTGFTNILKIENV